MIAGIVVAAFVVALLVILAQLLRLRHNAVLETIARGVRVYKYDVERGLIKPYEESKIRQLSLRNLRYLPTPKEWSPIGNLTDRLMQSEGEKLVRQALHDLTKSPEYLNVHFTSSLPGFRAKLFATNKFNVKLDFFRSGEKFYVLLINWRIVYKDEKPAISPHIKPTTREDLARLNTQVVGYIAFNTRRGALNRTNLVQAVSRFWDEETFYFYESGLLIFILTGPNLPQVTKRIKLFIKQFELRGAQAGVQRYYEGSAYIVAENGQETRAQSKILQALVFFVSLSIERKSPFMALGTKDLDLAEFKLYDEGLRSFKNTVVELSFDIDYVPVMSFQTDKELAVFARPLFRGLSPNMMRNILSNFNNKVLLNNAVATKLAISKMQKATLVVAPEEWLVRSYEAIRNRRVAYIVDLEEAAIDHQELLEVVKKLQEAQFTIGLKLKDLDQNVGQIIRDLKPEYIVIDESVTGQDGLFSSEAFIDLMQIAQLAKQIDARLIYENVPDYIDVLTADKIGLKYYYRWK